MSLPKKFELGGVSWTVKEVEYLPGLMGACDPTTATILILKSLPPETKEHTFYHEAVHACMYAMGKTVHDEEFVDGIATFLHQLHVTWK